MFASRSISLIVALGFCGVLLSACTVDRPAVSAPADSAVISEDLTATALAIASEAQFAIESAPSSPSISASRAVEVANSTYGVPPREVRVVSATAEGGRPVWVVMYFDIAGFTHGPGPSRATSGHHGVFVDGKTGAVITSAGSAVFSKPLSVGATPTL